MLYPANWQPEVNDPDGAPVTTDVDWYPASMPPEHLTRCLITVKFQVKGKVFYEVLPAVYLHEYDGGGRWSLLVRHNGRGDEGVSTYAPDLYDRVLSWCGCPLPVVFADAPEADGDDLLG